MENTADALDLEQLNSKISTIRSNMAKASNDTPSEAIKFADPDKDGCLPLTPRFAPYVEQIKKQFNKKISIDDLWFAMNQKMFRDIKRNQIKAISHSDIISYLEVCLSNNLDPLCGDTIATYYDGKNNVLKAQILLQGYYVIYANNTNSDGFEFTISDSIVKKEVQINRWEYNQQLGRNEKKTITVTKEVPARVECRIYRKDTSHPAVGYAFPSDIGSTGAWTEHPEQMMCNRAFTRAMRVAYSIRGDFEDDVPEITGSPINAAMQMNIEHQKIYDVLNEALDKCHCTHDMKILIDSARTEINHLPDEFRARFVKKANEMNELFKQQAADNSATAGNDAVQNTVNAAPAEAANDYSGEQTVQTA
ncbi:RecT family protein [Succinivibrio dextrinosolvens]|uniref:recombinase RecT n=1 Tax=Succinivibrio dextrinosolvens TaxID=83771 RepID=UPI0008F38BC8|nr:recombinase RecT [Succinivibrio dextrinosolvens]SFS31883.1 RecT family protein [Succinivibrio dextrinosolvens]